MKTYTVIGVSAQHEIPWHKEIYAKHAADAIDMAHADFNEEYENENLIIAAVVVGVIEIVSHPTGKEAGR